jgi:hypothetical protein
MLRIPVLKFDEAGAGGAGGGGAGGADDKKVSYESHQKLLTEKKNRDKENE